MIVGLVRRGYDSSLEEGGGGGWLPCLFVSSLSIGFELDA